MSWLSSLFSGHNDVQQPDTSAQQAEAQRQADAQTALAQQQLQQQQQIADQQRADDAARYQAQLTASQTESQRQYDALNAETQRQADLQNQANAQAEAERQAVAQQAAARAQASREYATGRQNLIDTNTQQINDAYAGFDKGYYDQFAQAFVDNYKPQLDQNYDQEQKNRTYAFADHGTLHGSDAADSFGKLLQGKVSKEGDIVNAATTAANGFQSDIDTQKSNALGLITSSGAVGSPNLPDGSTDAAGALAGIGTQLGQITTAARAKAASTTLPSFGNNLDLSLAGAGATPK